MRAEATVSNDKLFEQAMGQYARKLESSDTPFSVKDFFDRVNSMGNIPVILG